MRRRAGSLLAAALSASRSRCGSATRSRGGRVLGCEELAPNPFPFGGQHHCLHASVADLGDSPGETLVLKSVHEPRRVGWVAQPLVRQRPHRPAGLRVEAGEGTTLSGGQSQAVEHGHALGNGGDDVIKDVPPGLGGDTLLGSQLPGHDSIVAGMATDS
jgi:hypothetical protein